MKLNLRFPIRLKILVALLFFVTAVVSVITLTMANLFHDDKKTYVNDLVSVVSLGIAEEYNSTLTGYAQRLRVYGRVMNDENLTADEKSSLLQRFFEDFPELVGISIHDDSGEIAAAYDAATLEAAGVTRDALMAGQASYPPPLQRAGPDTVFIRNSTVDRSFPCMTMTLRSSDAESDPTVAVTAVIRLDNLMRLAQRFSRFEGFLVDADGIFLAHTDPGRVGGRAGARLSTEASTVLDSHNAEINLEFSRDGVDMIGGYAAVNVADVIAGVEIPASAAFLASRHLLNRLLAVAFGLLIAAAVIGLIWARRLTRPMERLSKATREIGKGRFDGHVDVKSRDEIGELADSFNQMTTELDDRDKALDQAQAQLIQSEKMAAFGQFGAGIAHEVKNPLAGILGCAQLSLRKAEPDSPFHQNLKLIEKETKRCKTIIENLLKFARQEKAVMAIIDVNSVIEDAVAIVSHQLEINQVHMNIELGDGLPPILGNANQIQQVLMNLFINAQQAMEGTPGTVGLASRKIGDESVEIRIVDDGPGMSEEIREHIFEPFFTTKPGGKGTGLGLSVSFGIIKDHEGSISVESKPGAGTTFVIAFPVPDLRDPDESGVTDNDPAVETTGTHQAQT